MIAIMQPRGVMVAQVILVHFVEVRILTGLPFFFAVMGGKRRALLLRRSVTDHAVRSLSCSFVKPGVSSPIIGKKCASMCMASKKSKAHSHRLAEHSAQCTGCGQCRNRPYRPYRPYRTYGTGLCGGCVLRKFKSAWRRSGGLLAGRAHCAMPILRAKNVGLVGLVGLVGRLALGAVCAMRFGISIAQGCVDIV